MGGSASLQSDSMEAAAAADSSIPRDKDFGKFQFGFLSFPWIRFHLLISGNYLSDFFNDSV